ncbi:MAG: NAD(P)H-binding protein, partial [Mycobacteriaceae bacterium]|nr:NAD(P)H-binding protein [Mycobacteriaceae bacterium]
MAIVVTGATGNVGRPLVAELVAAGAEVRAVSRRADAAGFPPQVKVFDTVEAALPGASTVFLNSRALQGEIASLVGQAQRHGVERLVALSAINADDDFSRQPSRYRGDRNLEVEQLAVGSGLEWVSLRPSVFATNFAGMWSGQIRAGDVVNGPYAEASSAPIAESDIGAVAARAVLSAELVGQRIALTGPQALTNSEMVDIIGSALHRPLHYREIPPELVAQRFVALGFPAEFGTAYLAMLASSLGAKAPI